MQLESSLFTAQTTYFTFDLVQSVYLHNAAYKQFMQLFSFHPDLFWVSKITKVITFWSNLMSFAFD